MRPAGDLDKRGGLYQLSDARDSANEQLGQWVLVVERWAAIEPISGREYYLAQERHAEVSTKVTLRYCPQATAAMRWKYGNRWYDVISVIHPNERHDDTVLMCNELKQVPA
jgi:SPP1 family predicted phage head-tail adaptor